MDLKAAIAISLVMHAILLGYAYTVEVPEEVEADEAALREFATVQMKMVRPDEISEDGSDDPAKGVPNPVEEEPEPKEEPEPEPEPQPESEPEPQPEPEPKEEPEPEEKPEPEPKEELKSVVTDKTEASDSPVETDSEAEATAKASASTAPVDSGEGNGTARADQTDQKGVGSATQQSGPRGVRNGTGKDQKKLNQKYGLILYRHISKAKSYPRFARKAGIEGKLLVEITVDNSGKILAVKLRKSSGHEILDDNTIETIRDLGRFPLPPDGVTWREKTFVLPVNYKLS